MGLVVPYWTAVRIAGSQPTTIRTTAQHGTIVIAMQQTAADVNVIDGQAQSTNIIIAIIIITTTIIIIIITRSHCGSSHFGGLEVKLATLKRPCGDRNC